MKKLLLGLGIVSLGCLPLVAVASCGSSNGLNTHLTAKSFQAKQNVARAEESVVDPSLNTDAQKILNGLFENLTVQQLQLDFNRILVDFYDIYEFESSNTEIELIDGGIKVLSIITDPTTKVKTAKLKVSYEQEKSKNNSKNDEVILSKEIDWIIRPKIIAQTEINEIKNMIVGANTANSNIDIKDLKEYFLGEKDDEADFDDIGVFDRINAFNKSKDLKNSGGLVGYEIKLNDIFGQILPAPKLVTLETTFFAPSLALNNVFLYPSQQPKLDYTLDLTALQAIDLATIKTYTTVAQLESFLVNKTQATATLVKSIVVEEVGPLIKVTVNFVESATLPEAFSINPNLLKKQPVTPPTTPAPLTK